MNAKIGDSNRSYREASRNTVKNSSPSKGHTSRAESMGEQMRHEYSLFQMSKSEGLNGETEEKI
jgi:hypothetical protein